MKTMKGRPKTQIAGMIAAVACMGAAVLLASCPVADTELIREPVSGITVLVNGVEVPPGPGGMSPSFEMLEGRKVVLGARLAPDGARGGVHWQTSRDVVEFDRLSGAEVSLYARFGGSATVQIAAANIFNEVPLFGEIEVTVIPTSYFKWSWNLDGWDDLPALESARVGRYHQMFVRSAGSTTIATDERRGGMVMEGPGVLTIGSTMSVPTNSAFPDDPAFDVGGGFNFTEAPSRRFLPPDYIGIAVDYEILQPAAPGRGLRVQVNNNTVERNRASALENWLVAELGDESPRLGTLRGVFSVGAAQLHHELPAGKRDRIQGDTDEEKVWNVLRTSFVALALPEGSALIRGIRVYNIYNTNSNCYCDDRGCLDAETNPPAMVCRCAEACLLCEGCAVGRGN